MAIDARDLLELSINKACTQEVLNVGKLVVARDQGFTKSEAVEYAKNVPQGDAAPPEAIENAYSLPELNRSALMAYALWSCHARSHGLEAAPLSKVAKELGECVAKPRNDPCGREVRNEVYGLPRDYQATPNAPPTPKPP